MRTPLLFVHGLGETPKHWDSVIEQLNDVEALTPDLFGQLAGGRWALCEKTDTLAESLSEPTHVAGLSLGAIMGLDLAIRHPRKVRSLFLSAPQARPPQALMRVQSFLMRLLPERLICPPGITRKQLLDILRQVSAIDLEAELSQISVPTTIACGAKDRANLGAARSISNEILDARLIVVPKAGHLWHQTNPVSFANELKAHLEWSKLQRG